MKQVYFAVAVNSDGTMYLDDEISVNYDEGQVWNEATDEWEDVSDNDAFVDRAQAQLVKLLETVKARN